MDVDKLYDMNKVFEESEDFDDDGMMTEVAYDEPQSDREQANLAGFDISTTKNWKQVVQALETVSNAQELNTWLRSHLFKPHFLNFYFNAVLPAQARGHRITRCEGFETIITRIETAKRDGDIRYTSARPDTTNWEQSDWICQCISHLVRDNRDDRGGVFYGKNWPLEWCERLMWRIFTLTRNEFAGARLLKGKALLMLTDSEWQTIKTAISRASGPRKPLSETTPPPPITTTSGPQKRSSKRKPEEVQDPKKPSAQSPSAKKRRCRTPSPPPTENADAIASESVPAQDWRANALIVPEKRQLIQVSSTMNLTEPWWQSRMIDLAMARVFAPEEVTEADTAAANAATDVHNETPGLNRFKDLLTTAANTSVYRVLPQVYDNIWNSELTAERANEMAREVTHDPPSALINLTDEMIEARLQQQQWQENQELQRENHIQACRELQIPNPDVPKLPGMRIHCAFRFWQPVAIHAIRTFARNRLLSGCILADQVGLGKTWTGTGYLLSLLNDTENKTNRPSLIVCPPHLVYQWASEVIKITGALEVLLYFGNTHEKPPVNVEVISTLLSSSKIFSGEQEARKVVVITSYQTLTHRHGPAAQAKFLADKYNTIVNVKDLSTILDPQWPKNLSGLFGTVILDEAHMLRNAESYQFQTIRWLKPEFHLLMTATPLFNGIRDFQAYEPLLLSKDANDLHQVYEMPSVFNPFSLAKEDPLKILCLSPSAIEAHIWKDPDITPAQQGLRLRQVWSHLMIRRSLASSIPFKNGRMIGQDIPTSHYKIVDVSFFTYEHEQYLLWVKSLRRGLFIRLDDGRIAWNMAKLRELNLITSWMWFRYNHDLTKKKSPAQLDDETKRGFLPRSLIRRAMAIENRILEAKNARLRGLGQHDQVSEDGFFDIPEQESISNLDALTWFLKGSPKLRAMLPIIQHEIFHLHEKSIIWCNNPSQQFYVASALRLCNIDVHVFHSELSHVERQKLVQNFNTKPDEVMVLVCSYLVNAAGSNLQKMCRNVHLFDLAPAEPVVSQAIGRTHRLGQTRPVKIYDYRVKNSFNITIFLKSLGKAIPDFTAMLNESLFDVEGGEDGQVDMGAWVRNADNSISRLPDGINTKMVPAETLLTGGLLIQCLLEGMQTGLRITPVSDFEKDWREGKYRAATAAGKLNRGDESGMM